MFNRIPVKRGGCPCLYIAACNPNCSCVSGWSSRGCSRCATYGSLEQKQAAAKRISKAIDKTSNYKELLEEVSVYLENLKSSVPAVNSGAKIYSEKISEALKN